MRSGGIYRVAKAGMAGVCSVYLVVAGIILAFPGAVLIGMSNSKHFQDDFFDDHNDMQRIIGCVLIAIACFLLIGGIALCIYVCTSVSRTRGQQGGVVLNQPAAQPLVSGSVPAGGPVHQTYPSGPAPAPHGYPPAGGAQPYPSQQPAYPPAGGYPSAGYPAAGGYPAPPPAGYPQPAPYAPPANPSAPPPPGPYAPMAYQAPPMDTKPGFDSATAPPSYQDVSGGKM